jgi:hypothetical protein
MAISLTEDEIRLLKQLEAAGEHGRTRRTLNSDESGRWDYNSDSVFALPQ